MNIRSPLRSSAIFLQGIKDNTHFEQFQQVCAAKLPGLEVEPKQLDQFLLIDSKSYIARYQDKGETIIEKKGLQGLKSDVCKWIRQAVEQFVANYVGNNNNSAQIISDLKRAYDDLLTGRAPKEHLKMYEKVNQDPSSYVEGHHLRRLALEQGVTQGGRVFYYYSMVLSISTSSPFLYLLSSKIISIIFYATS
jgi:DNA polymerase elongation subunit (family B)